MRKIAFVVQRYGLEVNGGAELECRQLAEHMNENYEVEILTTKAVDYVTWKDEYTQNRETVNGVLVRRFSVKEPRNNKEFNRLSEKVLQGKSTKEEEELWMKKQGPYSVELVEYIKEHKEDYDVFVFFTYLYYTTYFGIQEVYDKSILIPTAHDETPIYLNIFRQMFQLPRGIFYQTKEEKEFVEKKFQVKSIPNNDGYGGVGVEVPTDISAEAFRQKYGLEKFVIYIGRIDEHKGCKDLFTYFKEYKKRNGGDLKLVLMGKEIIRVPDTKDIISLGFVSDEDKFNGLAACEFLVLPSQFESLSMVVLEAMKIGKPVLVNGKCEVVKGHCVRSNGGLYYQNFYEFEGCMDYLMNHADICKKMGKNGQTYVAENYQWDVIIKRLSDLVEEICIRK